MDRFTKNILDFPDQLSTTALTFKNLAKLKGAKPDAIVLCGMGGSGIPASILQNIVDCAIIDLPIVVWKDFGLPHLSYRNPLFVFVSFSGNTAETLSGFKLAHEAKLKTVVSAGGALLAEAEKQNLARAIVPAIDIVPRQASGFLLFGIIGILQSVFPALRFADIRKKIRPQRLAALGNSLAAQLKNKIVLIYTPTQSSHLASIFKIQLTETGKTATFCNTYPEINHIELVGFDRKPKGLVALFPMSEYEDPIIKKLIAIDQKVLRSRGITPITLTLPGKTPLETAASALMLSCWTGLALAKLHKVDPEKTQTISEIKQLLKKEGLSS